MKILLDHNILSINFRQTNHGVKLSWFSKNESTILTIFLVIISLLAFIFYYKLELTLSYNDARSHLNVARRVVDSLQPGFAQIGSVWLPLYHILELPMVWNYTLWQTGFAGSFISMLSYVAGGIYLIKLVKLLKFDVLATLVALLVYALNPNLLFMQTAPMTESLLIFLAIATTYHVIRWVKKFLILDLITAGFFTLLSTLTRYDGWFLLIFVAMVVGITAYKRRGYKFTEGNLVFYLTLAGFGALLWFLWNLVIFGDPFYFALGPYSAKAQQDILEAEGRLFSKGNPVYSTFLYLLTVKYNLGIWIFIISLAGLYFFYRSKKYNIYVKCAVSLLGVPFFFNVISLIAGHSVIHLPTIFPYTWFNDRYGIMVLPLIAVAIGFLANKRKLAAILLIFVLLFQNSILYLNNDVITIEDGIKGASGNYLDEAGSWLKHNAGDGLILVAASSNDSLIFRSGFPLKRFITEGAKRYWDASLVNPTMYADWVVMHKGDLVEQHLRGNDNFLNNYKLVYKDNFSYIYEKAANSKRLTEEEVPK